MIQVSPRGQTATDRDERSAADRRWIESTVVQPMNDHGAMVVQTVPGEETLHLVEYANERTRELLAPLRPGDGVTLRVARLEGRGSCYLTLGAAAPTRRDPKA